MRWLLAVVLCGCNQVFGIEHTKLVPDYFDAPIDAPFTCPTTGLPAFKQDPHQVTAMNCRSYTTAQTAPLAAVDCDGGGSWPTTDEVYVVAPVDTSPDASSATIVAHAAGHASTMLAPEGDQVFITYYPVSSGLTLVSYTSTGSTWTQTSGPTLPTIFDNNDRFSRPSRGPNRRALHYHDVDKTWYELAETSSTVWTRVRTQPQLVNDAVDPRLSADGLRLTASSFMVGGNGFEVPVYTSRDTIDAEFGPFTQITTAPQTAGSPFLADDCGKLYYSGTSAVYFVEQQ
jgi:hypothetical protein